MGSNPILRRLITQLVESVFDKHKVNGSNPFQSKLDIPMWRNGRRVGLKIQCLWCVGSSPSIGSKAYQVT